jgi:hypothetical protein
MDHREQQKEPNQKTTNNQTAISNARPSQTHRRKLPKDPKRSNAHLSSHLKNPTMELAKQACQRINAALMNEKDIQLPPFLYGRFSGNQNLILVIAPHCQGMEYKAYLGIILNV